MVVAGKSGIVPLQFNQEFAKSIEESLAKAGLATVYINTIAAHEGGGNVHCRSNEVRVCQP